MENENYKEFEANKFKVKRSNFKKTKNRFLKVSIFSILIIFACTLIALFWYKNGLKPSKKINESIFFKVEENSTVKDLGKTLKEKGIIKSTKAFNLYVKKHNFNLINKGKYEIKPENSLEEILDMVKKGKIYDNSINVRIPEGMRLKEIAKEISKKTKISEEEMLKTLDDREYIKELCTKYWFLNEKEVLNKDVRHPLEGYVFPDTYKFDKDLINPKQIIELSLDQMDKILSEEKTRIEEMTFSVHEILALASILEKETLNNPDRNKVAGLFINRLNLNMPLGSDVTTHYEVDTPLSEPLTQKQLDTQGKYNTRAKNMEGKLPIGPIASVSKASIKASLYYKKTDAIYFVTDKNGKVYFSNDLNEHENIIRKLKDNDMWFNYN